MRIRRYRTTQAAIYAAHRPPAAQTAEIEKRLETEKADVLVLGTYPALCMSYIDPRGFGCEYPLSMALAVSKKAEKQYGRPDIGLGASAAYAYTKLVKARGGRIGFAGDILLEARAADVPGAEDNLLGCVLFDAKYAGKEAFSASASRIRRAIRKDSAFGSLSRKRLLAQMPGFWLKAIWYRTVGHELGGIPSPDPQKMQLRGRWIAPPAPQPEPLVSVVIRTRHRPEVLRKTLACLRYQAYKNIEYIVIEDGEPRAEQLVKEEFPQLNIRYHATGKNVGRAAAANLGFSMANGRYMNMLDDDDFLYPEQLLVGVAEAEATGCDMVFLQSLALLTTKTADEPYAFEINEVHFMNFPRVDPFTMAQQCMTANNGVLFRKTLYERLGGMREELGAHEDWALWLKYMAKASWRVVPYATNAFLNPYAQSEREARRCQYAPYDGMQFDDPALVYETTPEQLQAYRRGCIADWHCLLELGQLEAELRAQSESRGVRTDRLESEVRDEFAEAAAGGETRRYTARDFRRLYEQFLEFLNSKSAAGRAEYIADEYRRDTRTENSLPPGSRSEEYT